MTAVKRLRPRNRLMRRPKGRRDEFAPIVAGCGQGHLSSVWRRLGRVAVDNIASVHSSGVAFDHHGSGSTYTFGDGSGQPLAVRFTTAKAQRAVLLDPELKLGEAYMDGTFVVEQGSIADVLAVLLGQEPVARAGLGGAADRCATCCGACSNSIRAAASRRNVAHHYDLDGRLYSLFLDGDQQYSCAYFETPDTSLDDAQLAKKRHLAAKLLTQARRQGARYRLRLGRACALPRRNYRRPGHRHYAVAGAIPARPEPRRSRAATPTMPRSG